MGRRSRWIAGWVWGVLGCAVFSPGDGIRAAERERVLEEIVVTAQKRGQNLQDVPISVSAMTAAEMERRNIEDPLDVAYKTPGIVGAVIAGVPSFTIRGIGTNDFGTAADPAVGVYLDGVYSSRTVSSLIGLYDAERIEVIKGPQGTLFGRSAAAGAISVISKPPDEQKSLRVKAEYGNRNHLRFVGSANIPMTDRLFARISALSHERDGYIENSVDGTELANVDDKGARVALRWLPTDTIEATLSADYLKSDNRGVGLKSATIPFPDDDGSYFGDVAHDLLNPVSDLENLGVALHVSADLSDRMSLTSITAHREYEFEILEDDDGSVIELLNTGTRPEKSESFSQELRLDSTGGVITWMVGASYYVEDVDVVGIVQTSLDVLFGPGSGGSIEERSFADGDFTSYSVYADVTYAVTPRLDLIAGLRWTRDEKDYRLFIPPNPVTGFNVVFGEVDPAVSSSDRWNSLQPRLVLQYDPTEDVMVYASAARGYKPGGFGSFRVQPPFDPEFVWNYEVGVKSSLADDAVRLNAAAFYYDYQDLQVTTQVGLALETTNASEATGYGAELEVVWLATSDLLLMVNLALLDAEYDEFMQGELDPVTFLPATSDRSGNRLTRAPDLQYSLAVQYATPVGSRGSLIWDAEYVYQSEVFFHAANDRFRSQDGYGLLSGRITYQPPGERWSVSVFAENMLNEDYLIDAGGLAGVLGSPTTLAGMPRSYGIELAIDL